MTEPALVPLARVVATALGEDLGDPPTVGADVTASATVAEHIWARGAFVPRQDGVVAGLAAIAETYAQLDDRVSVRLAVADGDRVRPGEPVAAVEGPAPAVLAGERTALNLLTHLSGVATATRQVVDAIGDHRCVVRDTRKTLPGLRALQKAAVVAGGGVNHRLALVDGLLVKDNHVAAAGGFAQAVRAALAAAAGLAVQIEVDSLAQLDVALAEGVDAVLLDNFTVDDTAEAVRRCRAVRRAVFVESSGALTLDTVEAYAAAGVDAVSLGGLTHSAPALDIGLDVDLDPAGERS